MENEENNFHLYKLKTLIKYNKDTGKLSYIDGVKIYKQGRRLEKISKKGYLNISIINKTYRSHRICWFLHYGEMPKNQIDHINGDRSDNRITNLRDVTSRENGQNRVSHRRGRLVGAHKRGNVWRSRIMINNKKLSLGVFKTEKDAHDAYVKKLNTIL